MLVESRVKNSLEKGPGLTFTNLAIQARSTLAIKKWLREGEGNRGAIKSEIKCKEVKYIYATIKQGLDAACFR
jgi:hypothetical protein